jgi:hypothetical protein
MAGLGAMSAAGVGLFLVASAESFNIFSAMNSSPWTAENFGADEQKAKSCKEYIVWACVANAGLGVGASMLAASWWPLVGVMLVNVFMIWIYWRALKRGMESGSQGWAKS